MPTKEGLATGARGHFGENTVRWLVYTIGPEDSPYTMELCAVHMLNTPEFWVKVV